MKILVTGGAGYIGSHTAVELLSAGHDVVIVDNLSNSSSESVRRVEKITGRSLPFHNVDIRDEEGLSSVLERYSFDCCMHFAGLKAVGESVAKPLEYYDNNVRGTLVLARALGSHGCRNIIFSSSAAVYGEPEKVPVTEASRAGSCTNPYGRTKWIIEQILTDLHTSDPSWNVVLLRYFNPVGAHPSGLIGEDPIDIPNNLMSYITHVAVGRLEKLHVFGNDYPTPDGTGIRDYVHVVDLAKGHLAALKDIQNACGVSVYCLGTGHGYSVLEIVKAFKKFNGVNIPYVIDPRRPGDIAECWCDPAKAHDSLGWKAELGLEEMVRDSWNWQSKNPDGMESRVF